TAYVTEGLLLVVGQVFVALLMMLVVPVVVVSLVTGTAGLDDVRRLGRVGGKTVAFYLFTTATAIAMALFAAVIVKPGSGFNLEHSGETSIEAPPPLTEMLIDLFPRNVVGAAADGNILQLIVFSILLGIALTMAGAAGARILKIFEDLMEVVMKLVVIVMWCAPFGVFALIARVFAREGFGALGHMLMYVLLVFVVLVIQATVVYSGLLKLFTGLNPRRFLKKIWPAQLFAFSTASSAATIPVTLGVVQKRLGVSNSVASFTIPFGATVNMDGTAIMQGVATVFIAQAYGIHLGINEYVMVILTATLASVGTAGVPGAGTIMLAMVLNQVGLPAEGIAIVLGVDRLLDMARTAVNITGDATVSCIVAHGEKQLDLDLYNAEGLEVPPPSTLFEKSGRGVRSGSDE
ncbi:MAG TPA: dicarboxylate/amino acid:cation symporter, partial [Opitutales bacterium]|nr:dicarboxylate/amino acid:cation symporter [Opitutales bacterium]